jgi:hypothetical protein
VADWITLTLSDLGAPDTSTNRAALQEWAESEGMPASANNPLAASDKIAGWTPTPGFSEPTYPSIEAAASLYASKFQTLTYDAIGFALREGNDLNTIYEAINQSPWCSGCQGGHYPIVIYQQLFGGAGAPPVQQQRPAGTGVATSTHQVDRAWTRLMRTLAITAPQQLAKVAAARTRIRNSVR